MSAMARRNNNPHKVSTMLWGMGVIVASLLVFIMLMDLVVVTVRLVMG